MRRTLSLVLLFAVAGLIAGYLLFAKVGGSYLQPTFLIGPADTVIGRLGQSAAGVSRIRTNILISGGVGAVVGGLVSGATGRRRRR